MAAGTAGRVARGLGIAALVIGYTLLAHYTNHAAQHGASGQPGTQLGTLGALVAIAPLVLIALALSWRSPHRIALLGILALACAGLWAAWPVLERHYGMVNWLQHAGMQIALLVMFGRTLLAGRQPLCTRFADAVHGPLSPRQQIYTQRVTAAWSIFFAVVALVSTLLYFLTPLRVWSVFANLLTGPLVVLMFVGEYVVRRRVLPEMRHTHILDAVRAFTKVAARPR